MSFRLSEYGRVFSTRSRGKEIREELTQRLKDDDRVVISFDGVARVSQSFSDEFLGALLSDIGEERILVEGDLAPGVARVLGRALHRRGFDLEVLRAAAAPA
jgi:STAS-like domain of unknown function (DUF4325)